MARECRRLLELVCRGPRLGHPGAGHPAGPRPPLRAGLADHGGAGGSAGVQGAHVPRPVPRLPRAPAAAQPVDAVALRVHDGHRLRCHHPALHRGAAGRMSGGAPDDVRLPPLPLRGPGAAPGHHAGDGAPLLQRPPGRAQDGLRGAQGDGWVHGAAAAGQGAQGHRPLRHGRPQPPAAGGGGRLRPRLPGVLPPGAGGRSAGEPQVRETGPLPQPRAQGARERLPAGRPRPEGRGGAPHGQADCSARRAAGEAGTPPGYRGAATR